MAAAFLLKTRSFSLVEKTKPTRLFKKGHIQKIELAVQANIVYLSAECLPEMKIDKPYFLRLAMEINSKQEVVEVVYAQCKRCPAGEEPSALCKHTAAFFYALEGFVRSGFSHDALSCTDQLQKWNHPRKRKSEIQLATELDWSRPRLTTGQAKKRNRCTTADRRDQRD